MRALGLVVLFAACGFDVPTQPARGGRPFSNAGTGSSYPVGATITLDGSGSFDPDGDVLTYSWSVVQRPAGSSAAPVDASSATTTFAPDEVGTYRLQLVVTDVAQQTDSSELRIVATGAITSVDAGPDAGVAWLATAQLSGTVTTLPNKVPTYAWYFVSRPQGSVASLENSDTLTPEFVADATGTYVIAFAASVGDEKREDTVMIEATGTGLSLGTGIVAYTYTELADRLVYVRDVGYAEVVRLDPMTGVQTALNIGAFTPRSIAIDSTHQTIAVGGRDTVATVAVVMNLVLTGIRTVPGCTAAHVIIPYPTFVHCFPADGAIEPISTVNMSNGAVTQIPCPVRFPYVTLGASSWMYMVDAASPQFYRFEAFSLQVVSQGMLTGIAPPVVAAGTNLPFAVTGNGLAINLDATLRYDLNTPVSAGASSGAEIAVVSGAHLKIFEGMGPALRLSAILPPINGIAPTAKFLAFSDNGRRLFVVAGTAAGDVVYMVPR